MKKFNLKHFGKYWLPTISYMGLIFYFSSQSDLDLGEISLDNFDKVLHFGEYFILGLLFYRSLVNSPTERFTGNAALLAVVFTVLYGISDEFHQWFVPMREADIFDVMADTVGAVSSQILLTLIQIINQKYRKVRIL